MSTEQGERRRSWRARLGWFILILALVLSVECPQRVVDGPRTERLFLVDYGFHSGLALERRVFTERGLLLDLPPSDWVEIGWGDEAFYRETASFRDFDLMNGLRAVAGLGETAIHAVALPAPPERIFEADWLTPLTLDQRGVEILAQEIERSFARPLQPLGEGHWPGNSRFYRSGMTYGPTRLCNHWVSDALNKAGLPSSSVWSTLPAGLRWELWLRG